MALTGGAALAAAIVGAAQWGTTPTLAQLGAGKGAAAGAPLPAVQEDGPAVVYARALQEGDWNQVIAHTAWMQDRLRHVAASGGDETAVEHARQELMAGLSRRTAAGNQLTEEGIEDQYVFAPGSRLEVVRVDAGRHGLEAPVEKRVWMRVTYPQRTRAVRDLANVPIRSLVAGVNVSSEGLVLKANIVGNLDIDWSALAYGWDADTGG